MEWTVFIYCVVGAGFGSTFVGVLLKIWLGHRFSIERARLSEERKFQYKRRESSIAIADILAEWTYSTYMGEFSNKDRWRMQTTYWKNILLLDKELLDLLLPALAHEPDAPGSHELIVQARKILLGLSEPDIIATQLNTWLPDIERDT